MPQRLPMAKRFKLRLSRVIPSLQLCRSKSASATLPQSPSPTTHRLSPLNPEALDIGYPHVPAPSPSTPHRPSCRRHVSSRMVSTGCGCRSRLGARYSASDCDSPDYTWMKEGRWHVISKAGDGDVPRRKIYDSSFSGDEYGDASPPKAQIKSKKQRNRKKKARGVVRTITYSCDGEWLSDEVDNEDDETEALVSSSRSFSTDFSCDFSNSLETISERTIGHKKKNSLKKVRRLKRCVSRNWKRVETEEAKTASSPESAARVSSFRRLVPCAVDGKMTESFAVVKRSEDPYEDFKRSMLEMILEKQMFEADDLEQLLHCFLTLNSRHHHGAIVEAFSDIWKVLFCKSPATQRASVGL